MLSGVIDKIIPCSTNKWVNALLGICFPETCFKIVNTVLIDDKLIEKNTNIIVLSFDADTEEDTNCLDVLMDKVEEYGFKICVAAIGELVQEAPEQYKLVLDRGHELINHGYSRHACDSLRSQMLSYNLLESSSIENEIYKCQQVIYDQFGVLLKGFRVPHFGTFQSVEQLKMLYNILSRLGFAYSSSTLASSAYNFPAKDRMGIFEFPLTSLTDRPRSLFDSWNFMKSNKPRWNVNKFYSRFSQIIKFAVKDNQRYVLNFYFDPSHVLKIPQFEKCLELIKSNQAVLKNMTYSDILRISNDA